MSKPIVSFTVESSEFGKTVRGVLMLVSQTHVDRRALLDYHGDIIKMVKESIIRQMFTELYGDIDKRLHELERVLCSRGQEERGHILLEEIRGLMVVEGKDAVPKWPKWTTETPAKSDHEKLCEAIDNAVAYAKKVLIDG